jgi:hypothetical protein
MRVRRQRAERRSSAIVRPQDPFAGSVRRLSPRTHAFAAQQRPQEMAFDATGAVAVVHSGDGRPRVDTPYDEGLVQTALDAQLRWAERAMDQRDAGGGEAIEGLADRWWSEEPGARGIVVEAEV